MTTFRWQFVLVLAVGLIGCGDRPPTNSAALAPTSPLDRSRFRSCQSTRVLLRELADRLHVQDSKESALATLDRFLTWVDTLSPAEPPTDCRAADRPRPLKDGANAGHAAAETD